MKFLPRRIILISALSGCAVAVFSFAPAKFLHSSRSAQSPHGSVSLHPCEVQNIPGGDRCGTYDVFENRSTKTGRKISLNIIVLSAFSVLFSFSDRSIT
jgi:hypothetical protein